MGHHSSCCMPESALICAGPDTQAQYPGMDYQCFGVRSSMQIRISSPITRYGYHCFGVRSCVRGPMLRRWQRMRRPRCRAPSRAAPRPCTPLLQRRLPPLQRRRPPRKCAAASAALLETRSIRPKAASASSEGHTYTAAIPCIPARWAAQLNRPRAVAAFGSSKRSQCGGNGGGTIGTMRSSIYELVCSLCERICHQ